MTIAVIIPTLNEEQTLPRTLACVTRHGFDDILVVDGGSSDRTIEIVRSLGHEARGAGHEVPPSNLEPPSTQLGALSPPVESLWVERSKGRTSNLRLITSAAGRARQMNAGAAMTRADVLVFLHADTHLPDGARQAVERSLDDPACVGGRFDVRFERDTGLAWLIARLINLRSRWTGIATGDQALFVRRDVFERLGGFANLPIMEDVEFTRRLKRTGRVAPLRARVVTSYRRWERCGALQTIVLMWTLRLLYWLGVHPNRLKDLYASVR